MAPAGACHGAINPPFQYPFLTSRIAPFGYARSVRATALKSSRVYEAWDLPRNTARYARNQRLGIHCPAAAGPTIIFPRFPVTILRVMEAIKVGSTLRIHARRGERGLLWQPRFFDRALRSVKEYYDKLECIHLNPVRAGLVKPAEKWQWSSVHDYTGGLSATLSPNRTLAIDREGYISG